MADEQLISEYIDLGAVTGQTDAFLAQIKRLDDAYNSINAKSVSLGGVSGSAQVTAEIQKLQEELLRLKTIKEQLIISAKEEAKADKDSAAGKSASAQAAKDEAAAKRDALKTAKDKAKADADAAKAAALEKKNAEDLANKYKQLTLAYNEAALKAKNLRLELANVSGTNNNNFAQVAKIKEAEAAAEALKNKIRELDLATGNTTSSIGRYNEGVKQVAVVSGNAFAGVSKFYGFLRVAANIIPGLGISGIFLAGFEAIKFAAQGLGFFNDTADKTAEKTAKIKKETEELIASFRDLKEINDAAEGSAQGSIVHVQALAAAVTDQNLTYKERNKALTELKEINKGYFGDLTVETATIAKLTAIVNEYTDALINQAVLKELEGDIGKVTVAYSRQIGVVKQLKDQVNGIQAVFDSLDPNKLPSEQGITNKTLNNFIDLKKNLTEQAVALRPLAEQYDKLKKEIFDATKAGLDFKKVTKTGGDDNPGRLKTFDAKQDDADAKRFIELQKQVSAALDVELNSRIALRQAAYSQEYNLLVAAADRERKVAEDAANDVLNDPKAKANDKINARRKLNADLETIDNKFHADELGLEEKFQEDYEKIFATALIKRREDEKKDNADALAFFAKQQADRLKLLDDNNDASQSGLKAERDRQLAALEQSRVFDLTNKEKQAEADQDFNHKKLKIEADYLRSSLNQNIRYLEQLLEIRKSQTAGTPLEQAEKDKQVKAFEAQIAALKKQLAESESSQRSDTVKKTKEDYAELVSTFQKIQNIAGRISDIIGGAINAYITAQKNALQDQSDAIDANSKKELDAIANSTASEQDKAAKVAIINARAQAQKEQIALRQRQLDQQKAAFDKAANIANIITRTALAVVSALPDIPLAVIAGVLGAAELAVAIATPIPRYKHGIYEKDKHPGGPAIVGDGGRPEYVLLPNGEGFVTPARDTMVNIPRGSQVFPDANNLPGQIMRMAMRPMRELPVYDHSGAMVNAMAREIQGLKRAVMGRPYHGTHIKDGELRRFVRKDNSYTEYLNRNT
jgi:hypothetical protein